MANLVRKITLIFADAGEADGTQHNKAWYGELYDNNDVITRWGRVGYDLQSKEFPGVGEGFLLTKEREKLKKGYTPAKVIDAAAPVASAGATIAKSNLHEIAKSQILRSSGSPVLDKLIERLVKANVHKITSSTNITLNDATGLFQTPLGIVTPDAITDARNLLATTVPYVKNGDYGKELSRLVAQYLNLVPQNIGMRFNVQKILPDIAAIQKQNDILDSLEASYKAITSSKKSAKGDTKAEDAEQVFKVELDLETGADAQRLIKWFETSKKSQHGFDRIKVVNVFKVKINDMAAAFNPDNPTEVFHGSSMANVLSILKAGLKISPPATAAIAGKLFGNGIYGAINSSKSLGYTFNTWGQGGVGDAGFLFICDFSMGRCYTTTAYGCRKPIDYDSVWAKASAGGLYHDELIVYQERRVNPKYLLECK